MGLLHFAGSAVAGMAEEEGVPAEVLQGGRGRNDDRAPC